MPALAFATELLASLPSLIAAGIQVTSLIEHGNSKLKQFEDEGRDPSDADWEELNARISTLRGELHS